MDQLKIRQQSRHKPRHKISYQVGYNVWGQKKVKQFYRRKWSKVRRGHVMVPKFSNKRSLKHLFGERLKSKQVLRKMYGKLTEAQFQTTFDQSEFGYSKSNQSFKGLLDRRFDAFIYRIGFAKTIFKARQDVLHGSFKINGKVIRSPSYIVNVGDFVSPNENVWKSIYTSFNNRLKLRIERNKLSRSSNKSNLQDLSIKLPVPLPRYVEFDFRTLTAMVIENPHQNDIPYRSKINLKLVREFYK